MIIAKPEWFERRKYTGWGVNIKTWQGGVYLAGMLSLLIALQLIPALTIEMRLVFTGIWMAFLLLDLGDVMWKLKKDERERLHEAIAERNAAWAMMFILVIGLFIELVYNAFQQKIYVDPFIVIALVAGMIIKSVTNYKLERSD
jgi:DMSO reductase anchor subunit